ncbi:MAG: DUF3800 domain-containing protein [Oscillospiraceae bacterium]|jgi:hypothetical protein|nr:DUF3800 domain-containing protein [Oscillospiraceae bacterium]MBQ9110967.1 DUF3800 domain-containing protein [Oscillospiraceae bacterium]
MEQPMNVYVFSDESGVFDVMHNEYYVYGGLIFLDRESKDRCTRKYLSIERMIRQNSDYAPDAELKACRITNHEKYKLYKSLKNCIIFGAVVVQETVNANIFEDKKSKQRYLDYVYKIALKRAFEHMMKDGLITKDGVENIYIFADEHTTATNGKYELREALEQEFKRGTFNQNYMHFYPPIFSRLNLVELNLCDSSTKPLIRAADIIANNIYYKMVNHMPAAQEPNIYITYFPEDMGAAAKRAANGGAKE